MNSVLTALDGYEATMKEITEVLKQARKRIEELEMDLDLIIAERDSLRQELDFLKDKP